MFSLRGENLNLLAIMEHASLSLQPCGFVSDLQTLVWFPVYFFCHSCCLQKDLNFKGTVVQIEIILRKQDLISFTYKTLDI